MFSQTSVILFTGGVSVPACTTGHMTGRVSVWGGLCLRGSLSGGVSVRGSLSGGSLSGGLCPGAVADLRGVRGMHAPLGIQIL